MAKRVTQQKHRAVTPDDLASLVRNLGTLVRDSVREEVRDQLRPVLADLKLLRADMERFEGVIRDVPKMVADAMGRERERLANDMRRDLSHRALLGNLDLARHPMRHGATPEDLEQARAINHAFAAGGAAGVQILEGAGADAAGLPMTRALPDNRAEGRPAFVEGETPAIADGEVVKPA